MKLEDTFVTINGIRLHTVMAGSESGMPVILLHGFPEGWHCWVKQVPALVDAGCRVIIPDQRGYGLNDKPKGVMLYKVSTLVEDIIGLIDALDYEKVNLVGYDWAAVVAWVLSNKYPERLQHLCIMNEPCASILPSR